MIRNTSVLALASRSTLLGLGLGAMVTLGAVAQETGAVADASSSPSAEPPALSAPMQVGDATHSLLALQREGRAASRTPRPIPGSIADISYQRYLKSFSQDIPSSFTSSVNSQSTKSK